MAKNQLRGVNDIASRMSRTRGVSPRSQNATLLARLEQQKSLLEKQLQVWTTQKTRTEERMRMLGVRIRAVQHALKPSRSTAAIVARRVPRLSGGAIASKRIRSLEFTF